MKVIIHDESSMTIYVNQFYMRGVDFDNKEQLESYLKELFQVLKTHYDITISGYYEIMVYLDSNYGMVMTLEKEELEYIDYFGNQIDMRLSIHPSTFLYQIQDLELISGIKDIICYSYHNTFYVELKKSIHQKEYTKLLEHATIVFDHTTKQIRYHGKVLDLSFLH